MVKRVSGNRAILVATLLVASCSRAKSKSPAAPEATAVTTAAPIVLADARANAPSVENSDAATSAIADPSASSSSNITYEWVIGEDAAKKTLTAIPGVNTKQLFPNDSYFHLHDLRDFGNIRGAEDESTGRHVLKFHAGSIEGALYVYDDGTSSDDYADRDLSMVIAGKTRSVAVGSSQLPGESALKYWHIELSPRPNGQLVVGFENCSASDTCRPQQLVRLEWDATLSEFKQVETLYRTREIGLPTGW